MTHEVLVIGAGSIGQRHIRCFLATGKTRVSFAEPREELRDEVLKRYPGVKAFDSLDAAIENKIDVAVIATPAPLHVPQALRLVERGVHILIEKPLSVTLDGIVDLAAMVARNRVTVGVAYVLRVNPALAAMREALVRGDFGKPLELIAVAGQHFPFYRPAYAQTYYTRHETGGGAVQDALTHIINAGEWLIGSIDRVVADLAHQALAGTDVEDTAHVLARHGNVPAIYSLNQHQAPNETTITVVCARGAARFELHANRWRSMIAPGGEWTDHECPVRERDELFVRQANAFLDAVENKTPPACSLEEGMQTLKVNLAILKSARRGGWISVET